MLNNDIKNIVKNSYEENNYIDKFRNRKLFDFEKMVFEKAGLISNYDYTIADLKQLF